MFKWTCLRVPFHGTSSWTWDCWVEGMCLFEALDSHCQAALHKAVWMCSSTAPSHRTHWPSLPPPSPSKRNIVFRCWLDVCADVFLICLFTSRKSGVLSLFFQAYLVIPYQSFQRFSQRHFLCVQKELQALVGAFWEEAPIVRSFEFWVTIFCITDLPWVQYNGWRGTYCFVLLLKSKCLELDCWGSKSSSIT